MNKEKIMFTCPLCKSQFQHGLHLYGKNLKLYKMIVCNSCWESNWDGWTPQYEIVLIKHLEENSLPIPARNKKGWLPRD
ncbi:MAG: hypothetical protein KOO69_01985 [Victivallales bacterium]|nr:hypothetical protein [Victivallales bacterium]